MKLLCVMAVCGMCNRLRAVASGVELARITGRKLCCVWDKTDNCFIDYNDQFDPNFEVIDSGQWIRKLAIISPSKLTIQSVGSKLYGTKNISRVAHGPVKLGDENISLIESGNWFAKDVDYIQTDHQLQRKLYKIHKLKQDIQRQIDNDYDTITNGRKTLGIHIRGTDNGHCLSHSPVSTFISAISKFDGYRLLLATDGQQIANALRDIYGKRLTIINHPPTCRSTVTGMRTAIYDLFMIAKCDIILGSCGSTFSHAAMCLSSTDIVYIPHVKLTHGMSRACCSYSRYDYNWFKKVILTS